MLNAQRIVLHRLELKDVEQSIRQACTPNMSEKRKLSHLPYNKKPDGNGKESGYCRCIHRGLSLRRCRLQVRGRVSQHSATARRQRTDYHHQTERNEKNTRIRANRRLGRLRHRLCLHFEDASRIARSETRRRKTQTTKAGRNKHRRTFGATALSTLAEPPRRLSS
jgi:hypothetical protein